MVILGILGAIGYGIYTNFIGDARDTALDQNIQTAAAEIQSVLALEPTFAENIAGVPGDALLTAMTNRTNFVWDATWAFSTTASENEPDILRMQFIADDAADAADGVVPPKVSWLVDNKSAVRIHLANPEGEWRCALLILKPSTSDIEGLSASINATIAASEAAQLRGVWYDGGSSATAGTSLHDCSPTSSEGAGTWLASQPTAAGPTCLATSTDADNDECLAFDAQTWHIPVIGAEIDESSSAASTPAIKMRTLHRSTSSLDSNA